MRTTCVWAILALGACGDVDKFQYLDAAPPPQDTAIDACTMTTWYADCDGDGVAALSSSTMMACEKPAAGSCGGGWVSTMPIAGAADCNDTNAAIHPGATEICDSADNNCNGSIDENGLTTFYLDSDSDGHGNPASSMLTCNAPTGYVAVGDDCNDSSNAIYPGHAEVCDTLDNNCSGTADEGVTLTFYRDLDVDGHGNASASIAACSAPSGYVPSSDDCNDSSNAVFPGHAEVCDALDNNCNNQTDENVTTNYYFDGDGDGYGAGAPTAACSPPTATYVTNGTDCNDSTSAANPGHAEICDGIDNNCVNGTDEGVQTIYYRDIDNDGFGNAGSGTMAACSAPFGYSAFSTDCNDNANTVNPNAAEVCFNGTDDNCSGAENEAAKCSMNCDWAGQRWLSWGYDQDGARQVGAWVDCRNGTLNSMTYINISGQAQPTIPTNGASTDYVDCNWGVANRWASQGQDGPTAFSFGAHVHCNGTRVDSMSWGNNALLTNQIVYPEIVGQLACNWNGAIYLSYGWDGFTTSCQFTAGLRVTCSNNHITDFSWVEGNGGCAHTVE